MWQHWPLVVLILAVPVQYLATKHWNWGSRGTTYYLQRTFSSLDKKLNLDKWTTWPHELISCAKRFIFDYGDPEAEYRDVVEASKYSAAKDAGTDADGKSGASVAKNSKTNFFKQEVEEKEEVFDQNVHFAGSKEVRSPRHPDVQFRVGQIVRNKKKNYRGVIMGWDARPKVPSATAAVIFPKDKPELREQPFYAVLIDTRDRVTPQMDYTAQDAIELLPNTVIINPILESYFEPEYPQDGRYRMRPIFQLVYPED